MTMTPEQLHAWRWRSFERILKYVCENKNPQKVLEWGPGVSTNAILSKVPDAEILTVEHEKKYADKAMKEYENKSNVRVVHRLLNMKGGQSMGYINFPIWESLKEHGEVRNEYDLIFVDGRSRFDCIISAFQLIKDDGVVIVHDTHRKNYWPAMGLFSELVKYEEERTVVLSKSSLDWLRDWDMTPKPNTVKSNDDTMSELRERFISDEPFTFLRFGDADLFFIEDPTFDKNRRHDRNPAMAKELGDAFSIDNPDYMIGCVAGGRVFKSKEDRLKAIAKTYHEGKDYYSAVAFHSLYVDDPEAFVQWATDVFHREGKRVLLIGGLSICRNELVKRAFNVLGTIEFSDRNAYNELDGKMPLIEKNMVKYDIVISALGQATRVLGQRLWENGHRVQYFDIGSTVDALAERHLRSWIKRHADKVEYYKDKWL